MNFKVNFSNGSAIKLFNIPPEATLRDLKNEIEKKSSVPAQDQHLMTGFPPVLIKGNQNDSLDALGLRTGSVLLVTEAMLKPADMGVQQSQTVFLRRVIPADNSCLFNSIGYALKREKAGNGQAMRLLIKNSILENPKTYTAVFLGKPVHEYCAWILDDRSWGGEIELSILSEHYKIEIVVFDVISMARLCYGEDQGFTQRIFLLYDGVHYDVVVEASSEKASERDDITRFAINDFGKVQRASEVAVAAHQNHEYTDLNVFTIQCLDCRTSFCGQREAQAHAQETGHQQFGEIKQ
uniref:Ubiquitin thioesterase OTU n=1 Tax=Albugo laibachii Nc14 TaxID=890382 RepID=F0WPJ0_9STRA|nr:ubiquitin thioesterase OTU1like protein putative [Albugo laibachii Nc14]|eukprot:CCA23238.1 ubiquitin thioesterase OTU1like protein putative [Albugo laibachii Nc14]